MIRGLLDVAEFLGRARRRMRFGVLSREPLQLLRLEWKEDAVKCDWLMRPVDPWDRNLPKRLVHENQTMQALRDAISLRSIVFQAFPTVSSADLRMFRVTPDRRFELVMMGRVNRDNEAHQRVPSVAMRAKLCGFRFTLTEGVLECMNAAS